MTTVNEIKHAIATGVIKLSDIREAYTAAHSRPCLLNDPQIIEVMCADPNADMDSVLVGIVAAEALLPKKGNNKKSLLGMAQDKARNTTAPITTGKVLDSEQAPSHEAPTLNGNAGWAHKHVALLNDNEAFQTFLETTVVAGEVKKNGVAQTLIRMETILSKDELDGWPVPGSEGGNNPDKYAVAGKKNTGSKYRDMARETEKGQVWHAMISAINLALDNAKNPANGAKPDLVNMGPVKLNKQKKKFEARVTAIQTLLTGAINLRNQLATFKEILDPKQVEVVFDRADDTTTPITIQHPTDRNKFVPLSVGSFVARDLKAAKDKGGTYENVRDTVRAAEPVVLGSAIPNSDKFIEYSQEMVAFFENEEKMKALYRAVNKKDVASVADKVTSLWLLCVHFKNLAPKIKAIHDKVQALPDLDEALKEEEAA